MRAPQAASDDITVFTQEFSVALQTGPPQVGALGNFALHFREQRITDVFVQRGCIGVARGGTGHRDATTRRRTEAERVGGSADFEIDEMKTVWNDEADRSRQLLGDLLQSQPDQVA